MDPKQPSMQAVVDYFVDMAKGNTKTASPSRKSTLGPVRPPTTYHMIPHATPTTQALAQAYEHVERQLDIDSREKNPRKRRRVENPPPEEIPMNRPYHVIPNAQALVKAYQYHERQDEAMDIDLESEPLDEIHRKRQCMENPIPEDIPRKRRRLQNDRP